MSLISQALNGMRRQGASRQNFGKTTSKFLSGLNTNARKLGVGARHISTIGHLINDASGGMLSQYDAYNKGQKVLTTMGKLAKDKDMDNVNI